MSAQRSRWGALVACALALACDSAPVPLFAGVDGAHDVAVTDELLFITATDDNELRVVDLRRGQQPGFVRAPNPIHPLSIPVAERPVELARDVLWTGGIPAGGRHVYARSATGQAISVVDANLEALREIARIKLPPPAPGAPLLAGTITAMAGGQDGGGSTLYYAVFSGGMAELRSRRIPEQASGDGSELVTTEACAAIQSVAVLPDGRVAFSVRRRRGAFEHCTDPGAAEADRLAALDQLTSQTAFIVDPGTGARTALDFGAPIRRLYVPPDYGGATPRLFGLIDEDACEGPACRGAVAVDLATGTRPLVGGRPMRPVSPGRPLAMGLALGEQAGLATGHAQLLLGVIPAADGRLYFFDAHDLRAIDSDESGADVVRTPEAEGAVPVVESTEADRGGALENFVVQEGAARDEEVSLRFLGALPGFSTLAGPVAPATTADVRSDPTGVVEVGDAVSASAGCAVPAGAAVTVTAVERRSVLGGRLTFSDAFGGEGCTFTVRPGGAAQWVVAGTRTGYLGRAEAGAVELPAVDRREAFYFHFFVELPDPPPPLVRFDFTPPDLTGVTAESGLTLKFRTRSGFRLASAAVNVRSVNSLVRLDVAGAAEFRPGDGNALMVSYPSADAVLQVFPKDIVPEGDITRVDLFR